MAAVKKVKPTRDPKWLVLLSQFGACVCALQIFDKCQFSIFSQIAQNIPVHFSDSE